MPLNNSWLPKWAQPPHGSGNHTKKWAASVAMAMLLLTSSVLLISCKLHKNGSQNDEDAMRDWTGTFNPAKYLDITGSHGAVASDSALCSQMGVDVLKSGGNAADAAVQVALCLGSVEPQSCGIGGGAFITVRFPNGTSFVIDARETAPFNSSKHMFDADPILSKYTGLASGVPGEVMGLEKLWQLAGGQIAWSELVTPVAELNENGFALGEAVARSVETFSTLIEDLLHSSLSEILSGSDWDWLFGNPVAGSLIRRPKLGATLRKIAEHGSDAFYHGEIPEHLSRITQSRGGVLTPMDFANYSVVIRPALQGSFNGHNFVTAPAPASGIPLVMGLNAMQELQKKQELSHESVDSATWGHRTVEIMKWMAAARSELGDPGFIDNPKIAQITSQEWAHRVVGNISDEHTLDSWRDYHPSYEMNEPHGTTHFSVVDENGMAVAMTTTVNLPFGNGVCDPVTGVIMNSEMDDFSTPRRQNGFELAPSIYNFVAPGKRPLSSTVPTIMFNDKGEVELVIGAAGGSRIMTSVFLTICRIYGPEKAVSGLEAVAFPRFHHQLIPETLMFEPGFNPLFMNRFAKRGHELEVRPPATALNLVQRDSNGVWHAISDFYRKRGIGAAY